jgi:oligopeptide transport permease C-like protein
MAAPGRLVTVWRYMRRNPSLMVGLVILLALTLFVGIGHLVVDTKGQGPVGAGDQTALPAIPLWHRSPGP